MELEHSDRFHLEAAQGWLGLGDAVSASNELDEITPELRAHPAVVLSKYSNAAKAERFRADLPRRLMSFTCSSIELRAAEVEGGFVMKQICRLLDDETEMISL